MALATAEALARIGLPAVPALRDALPDLAPKGRVFAYASLGWIRDDEAYGVLLGALEDDPSMRDVIALALQDQGRKEAVPALAAALEGCEPWQRVELEEAIRNLHHGTASPENPLDADWRIRYRIRAPLGGFDLSWPVVASLARDALLRRKPLPVRPLEDIVAEAPTSDEEETCEECGEPVQRPTGLPVCPETAVGAAVMQLDALEEAADDEIEDLFELLDILELEEWEMEGEREGRSRRARRERQNRLDRLAFVRQTCEWLVSQGVEDVDGGRALLLAHLPRLRDRFGDPEGVLDELEEDTDPGLVSPSGGPWGRGSPLEAPSPPVGRNDPCPCGSGRKYKKCCGAPGAGGASRREPGTAAVVGGAARPAGLAHRPGTESPPTLSTAGGEAVVFCEARYRVEDGASVRAALERIPELHLPDEKDGHFVWCGPEDEHGMGLVLGTVRLERDRLVLETLSQERLERGRALLEGAAGPAIVHLADSLQDPWQAVAEAERRPRPRDRGRSSDIPPEVEREAYVHVMDRHYRTWPDEAVPALDGKTPRQAIRSEEGRRRVADLLSDFEEMEGRSALERGYAYDFGWLWDELGLSALR